MITWDYTALAQTYSLRPPYAARAIDRILAQVGQSRPHVADIGAGTGHLTIALADHGCTIDAIEPNEAMSDIGQQRTSRHDDIRWYPGTGEYTGRPTALYDLVTYGSSFNTMDRPAALREAARILRRNGHIACLWNHRDLTDSLQARIEKTIRGKIPGYSYGSRREDQAPIIDRSGLFGRSIRITEPVQHHVSAEEWLTAWRSHHTLRDQAGPAFTEIVEDITQIVRAHAGDSLVVPYVTVGWVAPRRDVQS